MIRPFQLGDLFFVQRLGRQATNLNVIQALLQPRSPHKAAFATLAPWTSSKTMTYVLRQQDNGLARAGFIQVQKRPSRPEVDVTLLAPALDTPWGHPAIWKKLLAYYTHEAVRQQVARIYVDVPDQPLPVSTFGEVGFKPYTRQTIWRLVPQDAKNLFDAFSTSTSAFLSTGGDSIESIAAKQTIQIRPQKQIDIWDLQRLYSRVTPKTVQHAEGFQANITEGNAHVKPLILDWWQSGTHKNFVLLEQDTVQGCILIGRSNHGYWIRLLVDPLRPDMEHAHLLLQHGLMKIHQESKQLPIYIGVRDYHGGLSVILADYGFAPFTDRARMVKHVQVWAKHAITQQAPGLEVVGEVVPTSFIVPQKNFVPHPSPLKQNEQGWNQIFLDKYIFPEFHISEFIEYEHITNHRRSGAVAGRSARPNSRSSGANQPSI